MSVTPITGRLAAAAVLLASLGLSDAATTLPTPAGDSSGMYSLAAGADGRVYLSWIDPMPDKSHALRVSRLDGGAWSAPRTIATGSNWFVNWADHPSVTALGDGTLVAHWLVNNPGKSGAYGYGIRIAQSKDAGETWREVFTAGLDNGSDYSGFVSLLPEGGGYRAVYLHPAAPAPMEPSGSAQQEVEHVKTLKVAHFSADGALRSNATADPDACSCCNTTIVETSDGPIAAYRDHRGEIRDISVVRFRNGQWTGPATVHDDGWRINACPTNGPSLAASGRHVAIAWFTAAGDVGRVRVAFSSDAGEHFSAPVAIDGGKPIGRPGAVLLDDRSVVVTWLESTGGGQGDVRLRRVWPDGRLGEVVVVSSPGAGRSTGIPQLARTGDRLVVAWRSTRVETAIVAIPAR